MNCLFQDGSSYHIEISPLICIVNQWISLYMTGTPVMKELNYANFYIFESCSLRDIFRTMQNIHDGMFCEDS